MINRKAKVAYGILEGINFPCFIRLVYETENGFKVQVLENEDIFLTDVTIDENSGLFIPINREINLKLSTPNYGIALSSERFVCGSKTEIAHQIKADIDNFNIYFRIQYYEFVHDYFNLMMSYKSLSTSDFASKQTKEWAKEGFQSIYLIINTFFQVMRNNTKATNCANNCTRYSSNDRIRIRYKYGTPPRQKSESSYSTSQLKRKLNTVCKEIDTISEKEKVIIKESVTHELRKKRATYCDKKNDYDKIVNQLLKLKNK